MNQLEQFYFNAQEPNKSVFLALKDIFLSLNDEVEICLKYGLPCFTYRKKIVCYHWKDKKTNVPYILFNYGKIIAHPLLEKKERKLMKSLSIDPNADIPIEDVSLIFMQIKEHVDHLLMKK